MKSGYLRFVWRQAEDRRRSTSRIERTQQRSREREHEPAICFFLCLSVWLYMLPSWPVIGNSLKSYQRPESKQLKLMVKSISGYRTHTKKCRYYRMTPLHNIYIAFAKEFILDMEPPLAPSTQKFNWCLIVMIKIIILDRIQVVSGLAAIK